MRGACDGRVILLGNDLIGRLLVLGWRDGRLRQLGVLTKGFEFLGFWWGDGGFDLWPTRPYCSTGHGTAEITGLDEAWEAVFAADSTEPDLPLVPLADRRPPSPFVPAPVLDAPKAAAAPGLARGTLLGPHLTALLEEVRRYPKRAAPAPAILDLATPLMDQDMLALLQVCAHFQYEHSYVFIGDFNLHLSPDYLEHSGWVGTSHGGILIGTNGGGDYYVAKPDGGVELIEHDAEGLPFKWWVSVEGMLEDVGSDDYEG
jgi:hypothetical protein